MKPENKDTIKKQTVAPGLESTDKHVKKCVQALLKLAEDKKKTEESLFSEFDSPVFLQINGIKVPKVGRRIVRFSLPHSLVGPNDEVALFVPDLVRGLRQDYEKTVDHWETILRQKGVKNIKEIIPMNRVKTEFRQYEEKVKLGRLFDYFLIDGRIAGHMTHILGKTFTKFGKKPIPVKLNRDNLANEINQALNKTNLEIHGRGNSHSVQVASLTMDAKLIVKNVISAIKSIKNIYPGGEDNIRSIMIKTKLGMAIPVYLSMANKNTVPVPKRINKITKSSSLSVKPKPSKKAARESPSAKPKSSKKATT